jgi:hypothetical protein
MLGGEIYGVSTIDFAILNENASNGNGDEFLLGKPFL